jgi:integrase
MRRYLTAAEIIATLTKNETRVFATIDYAIRHGWDRLTKRAEIQDLKFHDLRHEVISRFIESGLSLVDAATISGHRDLRTLFRYMDTDYSKLPRKID